MPIVLILPTSCSGTLKLELLVLKSLLLTTEAKTFSLKFSQEVPPTPGQPTKEPMFVPVVLGLLDSKGKDIPLTCVHHEGSVQNVASSGEPVYSTVLRVTKGDDKEDEEESNDYEVLLDRSGNQSTVFSAKDVFQQFMLVPARR